MNGWLGAWFASACLLSGGPDDAPLARFEFAQIMMGVPFQLVFYAPDETAANTASRAAFRRVRELNAIMSDYEPESELMQLCHTAGQGKAVNVSADLLRVLQQSLDLSRRTDGAFDVTCGPVVRLWRRARKAKQLPSDEELAAARDAVGYEFVRLDPDAETVELSKPGMQLDLGGIAKGYAADEALAVLRSQGFNRALVAAEGDIAAADPPPDAEDWRIGIAPLDAPDAPPSRFLLLKNAAVSTSGDTWQYVEIDGKRYSHIVDPRTGFGLTDHSSVTIVADNCTTTDSMATAVSVLGPKQGLDLVEGTSGAAAFIVRNVNGTIETYESSRLSTFLMIPPTESSRTDASANQ